MKIMLRRRWENKGEKNLKEYFAARCEKMSMEMNDIRSQTQSSPEIPKI